MELQTTNGYNFLIDDEDFDKIKGYTWWCYTSINTLKNGEKKVRGYYVYSRKSRKLGKKRNIILHRLLLDAPPGVHVDHINMNGLDNRRCNIRLCTISQNHGNTVKPMTNKSGYKGVRWHKRDEKWEAHIGVNMKWKWLGYYNNKEEAALAYNQAAIKYFGEFARLNNLEVLSERI